MLNEIRSLIHNGHVNVALLFSGDPELRGYIYEYIYKNEIDILSLKHIRFVFEVLFRPEEVLDMDNSCSVTVAGCLLPGKNQFKCMCDFIEGLPRGNRFWLDYKDGSLFEMVECKYCGDSILPFIKVQAMIHQMSGLPDEECYRITMLLKESREKKFY